MGIRVRAIIIGVSLMIGAGLLVASGGMNPALPAAIQQEDKAAGNPVEDQAEIDPKAQIALNLKPNEAGKIMVLMYHNLGKEESEWVRTPANFRKDLSVLYEKGYRPISLRDYITGHITTEPGFAPVVLTFDDGNLNNFEYLENGRISEDCAVGILVDFHEKHQDFPLEATFFLTGERPFKQAGLESQKLNFIIDKGMDIGNHTKDHPILDKASGDEIQAQIGAQVQYLHTMINRDDYVINTLALPFGTRPKDLVLTRYLAAGTFQGVPYNNMAVLNVGWNPGYSPYDKRFDRLDIPRIRASEMKVDNVGLYDYLDYFDRNPGEMFISDGAEGVITVPEGKKEFLAAISGQEVYAY